MEIAPGDVVLLCSDGLSGMLRDDEIARLLDAPGADPYGTAEALVRAANAAGGEDNVTVVVFEIVEGEPRPMPASPDETTSEDVAATTASVPVADVRKHGAGKGGRWPALLFVLVLLAVALLLVWWSLLR